MGGHGGLNILPQKKWNVYNWDNRIKVMENEKVVNKEIEKMERKHKDKNLIDRVKIIKNKKDSTLIINNSDDLDEKEKNKLFREIMQRKSMGKKLTVELNFEKRNTPLPKDQQLKLFDEDFKLIDPELKEQEGEKQITIKESLKNELKKPWYMQKRMEDFEFYKDLEKSKQDKEKEEVNKKLLKKKHKKEKKKRKRSESSESDTKNKLEKLRKERIEREKLEKERIQNFMRNNSNN